MNDAQRLDLKPHEALFFNQKEDSRVECFLCPRHCNLRTDQPGFCKVRMNQDGKLVTLNYGVSVQMAEEAIETEAVFHYMPGSPILSLGNIGCMLNCDFCHNWKTSQVKYVEINSIFHYTPEEVVECAIKKNIPTISWTYNDPVVWHEFVRDTSLLAKKSGLKTLYKSAFYIGPEAVEDLLKYIDIFSLSLKTINPEIFKRVMKGRVEPVLEAIKQVYKAKTRHLELSNLLVTELNDNFDEVKKVVNWVLKNLDENVPLHFVRFHPDYKYTHVPRTDIGFIKKARELALDMGVKHCYIGNVYDEHEGLNTRCANCDNLLIKRFGLNVQTGGLQENGNCRECNHPSEILLSNTKKKEHPKVPSNSIQAGIFNFENDIDAVHLLLKNKSNNSAQVAIRSIDSDSWLRTISLSPNESWRIMHSRSNQIEKGIEVWTDGNLHLDIKPVLDRAQFPV